MSASFVYTDGSRTLVATGISRRFVDVEQASAALNRGEVELVVAGLPFHSHDVPVLFAPESFTWREGWQPLPESQALGGTLGRVARQYSPSAAAYHAVVEAAQARIREGEFGKVVLSRALTCTCDGVVDVPALLNEFVAGSASGNGFLIESGTGSGGKEFFLGSSPESLVSKQGTHITTHPLAGTVKRAADPVRDEALATELLLSGKNLAEHAFVTADIRRVLEPVCIKVNIPTQPSLMQTSHTWHLGTPIEATLKDRKVNALDVAALLHPTPAVSGYPQKAAQNYLAAHEPDRGLYAGAVGWADCHGDGDFRVAIRSALVAGNRITARAGGGIVAASSPAEEVQETITKFGPVLAALGLRNEEMVVS